MTSEARRNSNTDIEVPLLLEAIYQRFHYDFRSYSRASLKRRITAALSDLHCESISILQDKLLQHPELFARLLQFLTIQVSDMFRDPAFFRMFRTHVVPELLTYPSVKLWVAGASTGEEVYSFAIALQEEGLLERTILYATDINPEALRKAEAGVYPVERVRTFSENYSAAGGKASLADYYTAAYGSAAFDRRLRDHVVFSDHSLATDSVFAEVHVVSCRNVLIYFDRELQARALHLFTEALARRGFLGLGAKETLQFSPVAESFQALAPNERWYQRW
jgi:chemotaxis protein methyltransferase CheR